MSAQALFLLQKAIYETLSGDAELMGMVSGVFDHVPQATEFPYVVISSMSAEDWSTKTNDGVQVTATINTYARERGSKTPLEIMERVHALLHNQDLELEEGEYRLVLLGLSGFNVVMLGDGITYVGSNNLKALVQKL